MSLYALANIVRHQSMSLHVLLCVLALLGPAIVVIVLIMWSDT